MKSLRSRERVSTKSVMILISEETLAFSADSSMGFETLGGSKESLPSFSPIIRVLLMKPRMSLFLWRSARAWILTIMAGSKR